MRGDVLMTWNRILGSLAFVFCVYAASSGGPYRGMRLSGSHTGDRMPKWLGRTLFVLGGLAAAFLAYRG